MLSYAHTEKKVRQNYMRIIDKNYSAALQFCSVFAAHQKILREQWKVPCQYSKNYRAGTIKRKMLKSFLWRFFLCLFVLDIK